MTHVCTLRKGIFSNKFWPKTFQLDTVYCLHTTLLLTHTLSVPCNSTWQLHSSTQMSWVTLSCLRTLFQKWASPRAHHQLKQSKLPYVVFPHTSFLWSWLGVSFLYVISYSHHETPWDSHAVQNTELKGKEKRKSASFYKAAPTVSDERRVRVRTLLFLLWFRIVWVWMLFVVCAVFHSRRFFAYGRPLMRPAVSRKPATLHLRFDLKQNNK